jgi:hypothetical protein
MECIGIRLALVGFMDVGLCGERDQMTRMDFRIVSHPALPTPFWKTMDYRYSIMER